MTVLNRQMTETCKTKPDANFHAIALTQKPVMGKLPEKRVIITF